MKMKEILALVVRVLAVVGLAYVTRNLINGLVENGIEPMVIAKRIVFLAVGLYFLRGAPQLLQFAYPEATPPPSVK
jgi:hypothetical protein